MAAPTFGHQGSIVSWSGTQNTQLIGVIPSHTANLTMDGGTGDRTGYAASLSSRLHGPGLKSWGGSFTGRMISTSLPQIGAYAGNIAFGGSDMYNSHIQSYSITIKADEHQFNDYNASATTGGWASFAPGLLSLSGTYEALIDATAPLEDMFTQATSLPTGTFTLTSGNTIACSVIPTQLSAAVQIGQFNKVTYGFQSSGAMTVATGDDKNIFDAGTLAAPEWDNDSDGVADRTLTMAAVTGSRTYAGAAFWTSININHNPAAYTEVSVTFRGSGALTIG